jgi:hypothetical protein
LTVSEKNPISAFGFIPRHCDALSFATRFPGVEDALPEIVAAKMTVDYKLAREPRSLSRRASLDLGLFTQPFR